MKPCKVCGTTKPLADFPSHSGMKDGHRNECRACTKKYLRAWRDKNFAAVTAKDRERSRRPDVREKVNERNKVWRQVNGLKQKVHQQFHYALKSGRIEPQPCWVCGETAEAHHPDYSAPLEVVWLCRSHHKQAHALVKDCT